MTLDLYSPQYRYRQAALAVTILVNNVLMRSLNSICGLPVTLMEEESRLVLGEDIIVETDGDIGIIELVPTLLNKSLRYPERVYRYAGNVSYKLGSQIDSRLRYDMYLLPQGLLGIEYVKTHIYYTCNSEYKVACLVEVMAGELTVVLQKNMVKGELDFDTHVAEAWVIKIAEGEKAGIPTGYLYTFVNSSNDNVVFSVVGTSEHSFDYRSLNREQGMAYFLIAKNAKTEVVTNPRYRTTPTIVEKKACDLCEVKINLTKPLFQIATEELQELLTVLY